MYCIKLNEAIVWCIKIQSRRLPGHLLLLVLYVMDFNSCEEVVELLRSTVCGFVPPPGVLLCSWLVPAPWEVHQCSMNTTWIAVFTTGPRVINSPFWSVGWMWGLVSIWTRCVERRLLCVLPQAAPGHRECWGHAAGQGWSCLPPVQPQPWGHLTLQGPGLCPGLCEQGDGRHGLP